MAVIILTFITMGVEISTGILTGRVHGPAGRWLAHGVIYKLF